MNIYIDNPATLWKLDFQPRPLFWASEQYFPLLTVYLHMDELEAAQIQHCQIWIHDPLPSRPPVFSELINNTTCLPTQEKWDSSSALSLTQFVSRSQLFYLRNLLKYFLSSALVSSLSIS